MVLDGQHLRGVLALRGGLRGLPAARTGLDRLAHRRRARPVTEVDAGAPQHRAIRVAVVDVTGKRAWTNMFWPDEPKRIVGEHDRRSGIR